MSIRNYNNTRNIYFTNIYQVSDLKRVEIHYVYNVDFEFLNVNKKFTMQYFAENLLSLEWTCI